MRKNTTKNRIWLVNIVLFIVWATLFSLITSQPTNKTNPVDNLMKETKTNIIEETEIIKYETDRRDNDSILKGDEKIITEGVNGVKTITYEVTYEDGEEIARKKLSETVTQEAINQIVLVGTYVAPTINIPSDNQNIQVYYKNCTEVKAAGAAPLYQGQPGYGTHLDRDKDGVACE